MTSQFLPETGRNKTSDRWVELGRFAIILLVLIAAIIPEAVFGAKAFMFRDAGLFTYPNAAFLRESYWHGEFPLWNPLNNCGIPFLAQWNMAALYPLSLLYIVPPLVFGLNLFFIVHLFVAGLGMYLLSFQWTKNHFAAAIAGIAFTFNGMTLNCLMWTSNLAGLAWMPWVVLAVEQAFLLGGRRMVLAALIGTMQMLTGAAEIIVFTWLVLFGLLVVKLVTAPKRWYLISRIIAVAGVVTLLSAVQLLPFFDLLAHSERDSSYSSDLWSIPLWGWANLFVPLFHCYSARLGVYFQPGQEWTSSYYLGLGVLNLAVLGLLLKRKPKVWLLGGIAIFGFWLALGNPGILYHVLRTVLPVVGLMQYPVKFVILATFTVPLLAAYGIAAIRSIPLQSSRIIIGIMALSISTLVGLLWHAHAHPFPYEQWPTLWRNGLVRGGLLLLILGLILIYKKSTTLRQQRLVEWALIILVWADFATHVPAQNPMVDASVYAPGLQSNRLQSLPQLGESRIMLTKQAGDLISWTELGDAQKDFLSYRCSLIGDCNLLDDIPVPDGFYALFIREQRGLFGKFFFASPTNILAPGFADFLAVSQVSDPEKILSWQERPTHLPFYSVGAKPEFVESKKMPNLLMGQTFDARKIVYLPPEAGGLNVASNAQATVRQICFSAQREEFEIHSDASTILVLSQSYYHPWQAYVNGQRTKIWRANYAFQAIPVPQGQSQVKLVYEDTLFRIGAAVSTITLIGCAIALRRKPQKDQS
jgi:hypothetical protein